MKIIELSEGASSRALVRPLFRAILLLQVLDLHSTLVALDKRTETNKLILLVASNVGLPLAVASMKSVATLSIFLLIHAWKNSKGMDAPVCAALSVMCLAYAITVINNYAG